MTDFLDKVVLVTGGGNGIGRACVTAFAEAGAHVVVLDRDEDAALEVADHQVTAGRTAEAVGVDITNAERVAAVVDDVIDRHGRIDVLHNNAGIFRAEGAVEDLDERTWDLVVRVNTLAVATLCRAVLPYMVGAGRGAIVNTSSAQARLGDAGWTSYSVAKAGVEALTRSIATQYGMSGIRCNAVAPGLIATEGALSRLPEEMVAGMQRHAVLGRLGTAEEIADVVVFLASERARLLTGQVIHADAGLTVGMPHLGTSRIGPQHFERGR